ncbi:response regulator transcription factor [Paenibacillus aquistagni]|uniref:DNA-binding response regulator, OmpR family, contains REC and winged-helix (WHTH) domain n=1 Tax=Paenibacillus aquistagni TaxID=1852522 RepID=A0A1X7J125_9BACL|nr:response regulator transcription factor [Paenibacillus aquistagni]NMM52795.1 response regulator transcription factor [Paenibacillus aquistagni]SMG21292.1 DNA-binding response regulator, OmpR family, contains REC and winged-helix (wHTH) domain [Paenibacillus aquistagni]
MKLITILIADDEQEIADLIGLHLRKEGYQCLIAADGQEALQIVQQHSIDLAILDIMMPKHDGYEVTQRIREQHQFPIIFLSAKTSDLDKITGLVRGADDYMTKPFNPMELVARVNAQLRRAMQFSQPASKHAMIEAGGLVILPEQRSVTLYGDPVELTPKEFDILYLLASYPKKVFSAENIFQQVWGDAYFESSNTVMVHIRGLRKKLKDDVNKNKLIKTVWGVGYTFNA